jgi:hypothetical protein
MSGEIADQQITHVCAHAERHDVVVFLLEQRSVELRTERDREAVDAEGGGEQHAGCQHDVAFFAQEEGARQSAAAYVDLIAAAEVAQLQCVIAELDLAPGAAPSFFLLRVCVQREDHQSSEQSCTVRHGVDPHDGPDASRTDCL